LRKYVLPGDLSAINWLLCQMRPVRYNGRVRAAAFPARIPASAERRWWAHVASALAVQAQRKHWPVLILVLHLIVGALYSAIVPIWEAYDETGHYAYVRHIATTWTLTPMTEKLTEFFDESHQPPLYYLLGALATFWVDTSDNLQPTPNVHARDGSGLRGFNLHVHSDDERFPWRGTVLGIHVARLVSVVVTTGTLWLTYLIGRRLFPDHPEIALGAMAVNAFLPQFLFMGAVVNNDALMTLTASAVLLAALRLVSERPTTRALAVTGGLLSLSLLTKNSGLALVPFIGLTLAVAARRHQVTVRQAVAWSLLVFGVATLLSLPWYGYSLPRCGQPICDRAEDNPIFEDPITAPAAETARPSWIIALVNNTFRTYWGAFGWGNIVYSDATYAALGIACMLGLIAAARLALRGGPDVRVGLGLIVLHAALVASQAIYRAVYFIDPMLAPGRYLLPAVSGLSVLLFSGWAYAVKPAARPVLAAGVAALLAVLALATPWTTIAPAYARPALLTEAQAMDGMAPVYLRFGDGLELLGYRLDQERVHPGETLAVTLVWRAREKMNANYTIGVHLLDGALRDWGQIDMYPGRGNYATSLWQPGDIIRDMYPVRLSASAPAPTMGRVAVGVQLLPDEGQPPVTDPIHLAATDREGRIVTPVFGHFKIAATALPSAPSAPPRFRLGDSLALIGFDLPTQPVRAGERVEVRLNWHVLQSVGGDYTAFLHALDAQGLRFQADRPPLEGAYPTALWEAGEVVTDSIALIVPTDAPAGRYRLLTGLYDPGVGTRLPAFSPAGERLSQDAIPLGDVSVVR
jgi:4-amino-4-deoxy-L-arabinose transferase-like glycosyltransferase